MKRVMGLAVLLVMGLYSFVVVGQSDRLTVVASFSILADVVQNVTLGQADVSSLIPVGADPHGYEPSARDLAALSEADVIFVAGGGFEEQLLDAIAGAAPDVPVIEASDCVQVRYFGIASDVDAHDETTTAKSPMGIDIESICDAVDAKTADVDSLKEAMGLGSVRVPVDLNRPRFFEAGCSHSDAESGPNADVEHGVCDPHVWSDPRNVFYWSLFIGEVLGVLDPGNADQYAANAEEYAYAIDDLARLELEAGLVAIPPQDRVLLTNHETLGYFAEAYEFELVGFVLPGGSTLAEPSAQDLAALIELVRSSGVKAIFVETTVASRVAEQVASETGVPIVPLYTDSLSDADGAAATYLDYMAYNFTTITDALAP
ncbi:MAG: zinc ABC transporter substrate-binding protein [Chloroflexi bacterium]|nr:zinc ABC transporter substrate-binding protein [Chloroflexota bacterium]